PQGRDVLIAGGEPFEALLAPYKNSITYDCDMLLPAGWTGIVFTKTGRAVAASYTDNRCVLLPRVNNVGSLVRDYFRIVGRRVAASRFEREEENDALPPDWLSSYPLPG